MSVLDLELRREAALPTIEIRPGRVTISEPFDLDPDAAERLAGELLAAAECARHARSNATPAEVLPFRRTR